MVKQRPAVTPRGRLFRELVAARGHSLTSLAKVVGRDRTMLSHLVSEDYGLGSDLATRIAAALNVDVADVRATLGKVRP
jgi:plasmid maintenance system antidote protein VapI